MSSLLFFFFNNVTNEYTIISFVHWFLSLFVYHAHAHDITRGGEINRCNDPQDQVKTNKANQRVLLNILFARYYICDLSVRT